MRDNTPLRQASSDRLTAIILQGTSVHTHLDLLQWMQGDLQHFLPHDIFMMVWTDPGSDAIQMDLCSAIPGVRTSALRWNEALFEMTRRLFIAWEEHHHQPYRLRYPNRFPLCEGQPVSGPGFARMRSALVHGQINQREHTQCLYIAFSSQVAFSPEHQYFARLLTPCLHVALQQVPPLADKKADPHLPTDHLPQERFGLSPREQEIMDWVRAGKTNEVIGRILDISPYTVKNHLKRIFSKLGVSNRAHAVSILNDNILNIRPPFEDSRNDLALSEYRIN